MTLVRVLILFTLISQSKHMLWVLKRTILNVVGAQKNRRIGEGSFEHPKHISKLTDKIKSQFYAQNINIFGYMDL